MAVGSVFAMTGESFNAALASLAIGPMLAVIAMYFLDDNPPAKSE